ncbi:TolC family protein, partial [Planktotalea sp.]|uniref:TolC family protein n=1 Tax=Planktotalea sp. TaxID=2029877 RepID=UPI00329A0D01
MNGLKLRSKRLLTAIGLSFMSLQAAQAETLSDALISAFNHSGLLEQNRALLRAADEDVAIATAALRPIISFAGGLNRSFSRTTAFTTNTLSENNSTTATMTISADLLLYDGGQSKFAIEAAKENVLATRARLLAVEQNVLLRAVTAYLEVRNASETVALRQSNVRLIQQELRA